MTTRLDDARAAEAVAGELRPLQIEANGINVITGGERKGRPRSLFWPWFAANVSVLGLSYGSFVLGFGISFGQSVAVGLAGILVSFLLCGFIAVAGKRGSAPTMVLSRAAFGVRGALAQLAGLPARPGRAWRQGGRLGTRQSRRADRAGAGIPGHSGVRAPGGSGPGVGACYLAERTVHQ
jgi:hypothetical protein